MSIIPFQLPSVLDTGYLLLEPSNLPTEACEGLPEMRACVPSFLWKAQASMPRLLGLSNLAPAQREIVCRMLEYEESERHPPVVCAWLQSDGDIEELAKYVARNILGAGLDGQQVIWRYYDPRVFVLAAHLYTDEQRHALLGVIDTWMFRWRGQWWAVRPERPFVPSPYDLDRAWPTAPQWELLSQSETFHRLYKRLSMIRSSPHECLDELAHSITAFNETARYRHEGSVSDRAEFTFLSIRYRRAFRTYHRLISSWDRLHKKEITLKEMLAVLEPQDMDCLDSMINETRRMA
jgi:hypothetical protein